MRHHKGSGPSSGAEKNTTGLTHWGTDDNGYCGVYAAGDLKRGWTTRVSVTLHFAGRPMDCFKVIQELKNDPGKALKKAQEAHAACVPWEKDKQKCRSVTKMLALTSNTTTH
ncbi:hypothetical protein [Cognatiyoonia sp. IB215182]|uniref:hypothetical protein n=1 Tax=Cognatiyoonia sp. IB215182 TaxID=3097353 RepID=UPI002A1432E0|nr:hypothetical protein [Cognatiyoonia sp. IB215182]MDX8355824.1 hypothetical protein [Cognatiyoonia sp. IB215182]